MKALICDGCHNKIVGDCMTIKAASSTGELQRAFTWGVYVPSVSCCDAHKTSKTTPNSLTPNFTVSNADELAWCSFLCFVSWMKKQFVEIKCDERLEIAAVAPTSNRTTRKELTP